AEGPVAASLGSTSLIDVSDGLLADVGHLAEDSAVAIDVVSDVFEVDEPLQAVGAALGADPLRFVLTGGDDHALVGTFPAGVALPEAWTVIGHVSEGSGVTVDGAPYDGPTGHTHF
ncbi:MAG: thiamine-phosphate kinase, partial [Nocardioidaceae bacterium]